MIETTRGRLIDVRSGSRLLLQLSPDGRRALVRVRGVYHEIDLAQTVETGQAVIVRIYVCADCPKEPEP